MRVELSQEAAQALKEIRAYLLTQNKFIDSKYASITNQIIQEFKLANEPKRFDQLAQRLIGIEGKRNALLDRLAILAQSANEEKLSELERKLKALEARKAESARDFLSSDDIKSTSENSREALR